MSCVVIVHHFLLQSWDSI